MFTITSFQKKMKKLIIVIIIKLYKKLNRNYVLIKMDEK